MKTTEKVQRHYELKKAIRRYTALVAELNAFLKDHFPENGIYQLGDFSIKIITKHRKNLNRKLLLEEIGEEKLQKFETTTSFRAITIKHKKVKR